MSKTNNKKGYLSLLIIVASIIIILIIIALFLISSRSGLNKSLTDLSDKCNSNKSCYAINYALLAIEKKDISICDKAKILTYDELDGYGCFFEYLHQFPDINECRKTIFKGYWCYTILAKINNDYTICFEVKNNKYEENKELGRDWCLSEFVNVSIEICDEMGKNSYRTSCVHFYAEKQENISICTNGLIQRENEEITRRDVEVCKYMVALKTKNISLCEDIKIDYTKQLCINELTSKII